MEIPGATGQKYIAYTVGNYYVITTQNGCSSTASNSIQLVTITANEINISTSYQLYPNPNQGIFDIKVETAGREIYNIEICNNLGTLVWKQDGVNINGTYTAHVDLYSSPAGMYTVALRNKANSIVKKMVIMK